MTDEEKWLLSEKYGGEKTAGFFADLDRLHAGEPLAYLIGHVPFLNCRIHLDSWPLIPRPETEFWVDKAIAEIKIKLATNPRIIKVLDICAGSGCVGIAVAKSVPEAQVTFAELDAAHLPTIEKNIAENLSSQERFQVVQSDLFGNISGQFDFILSNPPYIDPAIDRAETSVKAHEPHLALYGGQGGMEIIERLIKTVSEHLAQGGQVWIEHEPEQAGAVKKSAEAEGFRAATHVDQYGVPRFSVLVR